MFKVSKANRMQKEYYQTYATHIHNKSSFPKNEYLNLYQSSMRFLDIAIPLLIFQFCFGFQLGANQKIFSCAEIQ